MQEKTITECFQSEPNFVSATQPFDYLPPFYSLTSFLEMIAEIAVVFDREGQILSCNATALRISGFDKKELLGHRLYQFVELKPEQERLIKDGLENGTAVRLDTLLLRKSEPLLPVRINVSPLRRDPAKGVGMLLACDISDFKKELDQQQRLSMAVEHTAESIIITDAQGVIEYVNPAFEKITGYSRDEIIGQSLDVLSRHDRSCSLLDNAGDSLQRGQIWQGRLVNRSKDNQPVETEATLSPISDDRGKITNYVSVQRDVSHEVRLERQLRQAQKMEAIGTLAGGIAHDFNNLLMGIQGNVSLLLSDMDLYSPSYENLKKIEQYVQSGADLSKQVLGFARGGKYKVHLTNINDIISEQNLMFGRTNKGIVFEGRCSKDLWSVEVDRGQIEQVFMNIYLNAIQAMPDGGKLSFSTENTVVRENRYTPYYIKAGNYVKICLSDTGIGMDEETLQKIFDPFFTTKEKGRGTGLGLASVYGIIKNHDGFIEVDSKVGQGTRFEIYLPASDRKILPESKSVENLVPGNETVLFVDDEAMILDVGRRMLEKLGYRVLTVDDGLRAVEVYQNNQDAIDIVILDMIMPRMGGSETFNRLKQINPRVKVLLSSGYSLNGQANEILARGCIGFLQKPFNLQNLSRSIRAGLDNA